MSAAEKLQQRYTYADYAQWPDDNRWELINGEMYAMTAPLRLHQDIVFELARQIGNYLQGKPCKGYVAPFDVRLPRQDEADDKVETVVQPDLSVICDQSKLDKLGCRGIPDWIVEVLSPSSMLKDMNTKRAAWIERILACPPGVFGMDEPTAVQLFPDLSIDWSFMAEA